jgi:hypothetical protein
LDFGRGFYMTILPEQAEAWARRRAADNMGQVGIVSEYDLLLDESLDVLAFSGYDYDWLTFVVGNRSDDIGAGRARHDVVIGGIADDRVIDTINYYVEEVRSGRASKELTDLTLRQLSYQTPNDQVCLRSERALRHLRFLRSYEVSP